MVLMSRVGLLVLAVLLPFLLSASVQAASETQPAARIAYVKVVCAEKFSVIIAADGAGRHREMITRPGKCRHGAPDRLDESPVWAPDGRSLAFLRSIYVGDASPHGGVYIWTRGQEKRRRIDAALVALPPVWAPDGQQLALATESLWLASRHGPAKRTLVRRDKRANVLSLVGWSPDGSRIMFVADNNLSIVPAAGGRTRIVARDVSTAAWSPDGNRIAYASSCFKLPGYSFRCDLYVVSANGGKPRRFPLTATDMSFAWERNGDHLLVGSFDSGGLRIVDVSTGGYRTALASSVEFLPTTGPNRDDVRLVRIDGVSLALLRSTGEIETNIVVPRGWSTDEVSAYVR